MISTHTWIKKFGGGTNSILRSLIAELNAVHGANPMRQNWGFKKNANKKKDEDEEEL